MLVAVGGQCRRVGKTSLICSIIRETADAGWIAAKISAHRHGAEIEEELDREVEHDTGRFLRAGARRAFRLRGTSRLSDITGLGPLIVESNSVLAAAKPDLYYLVLNPEMQDFKDSARLYGAQADAIVSQSGLTAPMRDGQPVWAMTADYRCPDVIDQVRNRLAVR